MKIKTAILSGLIFFFAALTASANCIDAYVKKIAHFHNNRVLALRDDRYDERFDPFSRADQETAAARWLPNSWGGVIVYTASTTIPGIIFGAMIGGGEGVMAAEFAATGVWAGPAIFVGIVSIKETVFAIRESHYKKVLRVLDELHDPEERAEGRRLKKLFKKVTGLDPKLYAESYESYLKFLDYTEEHQYFCRNRLFTFSDFKRWLREAWVPYKHDWLM